MAKPLSSLIFRSHRETILLSLLVALAFYWVDQRFPRLVSPLVEQGRLTCRALEPLVSRLEQLHVAAQDARLKEERFSRVRLAREVRRQLADRVDPTRDIFLRSEAESLGLAVGVTDIQVAAELFLEGDCRRFERVLDLYRLGLERLQRVSPLAKASPQPDRQLMEIAQRLQTLERPERSAEVEDFLQTWAESEQDLVEKSQWRLALRYREQKLAEPRRNDRELLDLSLRAISREREPQRAALRSQLPSLVFGIIVGSLDTHSHYYSEEEFQRFWRDHQSTFGGLGIQIREDFGGVRVVHLMPGGPAERQGTLRPSRGRGAGDLITRLLAVEQLEEEDLGQGKKSVRRSWRHLNLSLEGMESRRVAEFLVGPVGTRVILEVQRADASAPVVLTLERGAVATKQESIHTELVNWPATGQKFGYIKLERFYGGSLAGDFARQVQGLVRQGLSGLLLDLRDNPGGDLGGALQVASLFLGTRPLVLDVDSLDRSVRAHWGDGPERISGPLVVLVNENSASAAEILAGSLQTFHRAIVVGSRHTYGKGSIQAVASVKQLFNLDGELGGLKYTSSYYYLPDGTPLHGRGVVPDILVSERMVDSCARSPRDQQFALPPPAPLRMEGVDIKSLASINHEAFVGLVSELQSEQSRLSAAAAPKGKGCLPLDSRDRQVVQASERARALNILARFSRWWEKSNSVAGRLQPSRGFLSN